MKKLNTNQIVKIDPDWNQEEYDNIFNKKINNMKTQGCYVKY